MTALFARKLVRAGHVRSFHIDYGPGGGWETASWTDEERTDPQRHTDWHRVERTLRQFTREIAELHREGWLEADIAR